MNIRQILLTGATVMVLTTCPVWAGGANGNNGGGNDCSGNSCGGGKHFKAPEIDAKSGTNNALALLTGVLVLVNERSRSRHSNVAGAPFGRRPRSKPARNIDKMSTQHQMLREDIYGLF